MCFTKAKWAQTNNCSITKTCFFYAGYIFETVIRNKSQLILDKGFFSFSFFLLPWQNKYKDNEHQSWLITGMCDLVQELPALTNSVQACISQLVDGGLLINSILVFHFNHSTHLKARNIPHSSNVFILSLWRPCLCLLYLLYVHKAKVALGYTEHRSQN